MQLPPSKNDSNVGSVTVLNVPVPSEPVEAAGLEPYKANNHEQS